jgi:hypothetical protein
MSGAELTLSFLPLQYRQAIIRLGTDSEGRLICVAADIVKPLGYRDATHALRILDSDEQGYTEMETPGGRQRVLYVTESGFYHLVFGSRRDEAKEFRRWVTEDILPTLRRTGTYTTPGAAQPSPSPHLPPQPFLVQERAHISEYLLAIWGTLRQATEPLTNAELARRNAMKVPTVRKWTRYLLHLGLLDLYELAPCHLFAIAPQADKRHAAYYQRLERLAAIVEQRQRHLLT